MIFDESEVAAWSICPTVQRKQRPSAKRSAVSCAAAAWWLTAAGWDDYLERGGVCAVEWSENVESALPADTVYVTIRRDENHEDWRHITVTGGDE